MSSCWFCCGSGVPAPLLLAPPRFRAPDHIVDWFAFASCGLPGSPGNSERSNGVAGCDPARLWAKLTPPPNCRFAPGGTLPLPMGTPAPNHWALLLIGACWGPFGNLLRTPRPACCGCCFCCGCWPPNPPCMPRSAGTAPGRFMLATGSLAESQPGVVGWFGRGFVRGK